MNLRCLLFLAPVLFACKSAQRRSTPITAASQSPSTATPTPTEDKKEAKVAVTQTHCQKPASFQKNLESTADVIALINLMPKPLSLPCFVDILDRPLSLYGTSNPLSGQPAETKFGPRIIFFVSKTLILGVVAAGSSKDSLEIGQLVGDDYAVRGELRFPIAGPLAADAPYTTAKLPGGERTICFFCHEGETKAGPGFPDIATKSKTRVFDTQYRIPLSGLSSLHKEYQYTATHECDLLRSLFHRDQLQDQPVAK